MMRTVTSLLAAALLLLTSFGCDSPEPDRNPDLEDAVARVCLVQKDGQPLGQAFPIAPGVLVTAQHVAVLAPDTVAAWNRDGTRSADNLPILEIIFDTDGQDAALLIVERNPEPFKIVQGGATGSQVFLGVPVGRDGYLFKPATIIGRQKIPGFIDIPTILVSPVGCPGSSGGPLLIWTGTEWTVAAIVVAGHAQCGLGIAIPIQQILDELEERWPN